jgi:hypothetical protein
MSYCLEQGCAPAFEDITAIPQCCACRTAAAAAKALDSLLAGILLKSGLFQGASLGGQSNIQTHQRLPADLQELTQRISAACSKTGHSLHAVQKTAELSSFLLAHYEQQQEQQWAALPSIQVSAADALVNALNLVAYSQV